jgi:hypothetical protein
LFIMDNFFGRIKIVHMGFKAILRGWTWEEDQRDVGQDVMR